MLSRGLTSNPDGQYRFKHKTIRANFLLGRVLFFLPFSPSLHASQSQMNGCFWCCESRPFYGLPDRDQIQLCAPLTLHRLLVLFHAPSQIISQRSSSSSSVPSAGKRPFFSTPTWSARRENYKGYPIWRVQPRERNCRNGKCRREKTPSHLSNPRFHRVIRGITWNP